MNEPASSRAEPPKIYQLEYWKAQVAEREDQVFLALTIIIGALAAARHSYAASKVQVRIPRRKLSEKEIALRFDSPVTRPCAMERTETESPRNAGRTTSCLWIREILARSSWNF
jgi:hypothetical protein